MLYYKNFSEQTNLCLTAAVELAGKLGHLYVGSEHLLAGILEEGTSRAAVLLCERKVTRAEYLKLLRQKVGTGVPVRLSAADLTANAAQILADAAARSEALGESHCWPEQLLAALMRRSDCTAARWIGRFGADREELLLACETGIFPAGFTSPHPAIQPGGKTARHALEKYGRDLTLAAAKGALDPCIGREKELDRLMEVLCRRQKNNPCLVGEAGVGKTAVVEGLALRMAQNKVPPALANRRLICLDLPALVAGTKYRGDFEERFKGVLADAASETGCVLFIDEVHDIVGAGAAEGAIDAASILKPALARGQLRFIGATTQQEYQQTIGKDPALARRFAKVQVDEPTPEACVAILKGLVPRYENYHRLRIEQGALQAAVDYSTRCFPERRLPDKAIDLLDDAAARVQVTAPNQRLVTRRDVAAAASRASGIPVGELDRTCQQKLLQLPGRLSARVIGQSEAVACVCRALGRWGTGLCSENRPLASFLFLGPSGVGKTELCRALAEEMFGGKGALLRFDMSEYMERQDAARLIGSAPGYVGHEEGGQLTDAVRRKPYSVVLLDEIEKAHPDISTLLLQVLEEGELTDGCGCKVSFRNTVVVMTGNLGQDALWQAGKLGFCPQAESADYQKQAALEASRAHFRRELLGRLDETVVFKPLGLPELCCIAQLEAKKLAAQAARAGVQLEIGPEVISHLAAVSQNPRYGARALRGIFNKKIQDPLSTLILSGKIIQKQKVVAGLKGSEICLSVLPLQAVAGAPATTTEQGGQNNGN